MGMRQKPTRPQSTATHSTATNYIATFAFANKQLSKTLSICCVIMKHCTPSIHSLEFAWWPFMQLEAQRQGLKVGHTLPLAANRISIFCISNNGAT